MNKFDLQTIADSLMAKHVRHEAVGRKIPEPRNLSSALLTLRDVLRTQRWAWRPGSSAEFPTYSFDGINFWWQPRRDERVMVAMAVVPSDGWRHQASCGCEVCIGSQPGNGVPAAVGTQQQG